MVKAYPIDSQGVQIGEIKTFEDGHFARMRQSIKKNFPWKVVEQTEEVQNEFELVSTLGAKSEKEENKTRNKRQRNEKQNPTGGNS